MTSIEELSKQLIELESNIVRAERAYRDSIMVAKSFEKLSRDARKARNHNYKFWVNLRKRHKALKSKITALPYRVRKWGRDNPGKLLNTLER
jgi:hypothetical protein